MNILSPRKRASLSAAIMYSIAPNSKNNSAPIRIHDFNETNCISRHSSWRSSHQSSSSSSSSSSDGFFGFDVVDEDIVVGAIVVVGGGELVIIRVLFINKELVGPSTGIEVDVWVVVTTAAGVVFAVGGGPGRSVKHNRDTKK